MAKIAKPLHGWESIDTSVESYTAAGTDLVRFDLTELNPELEGNLLKLEIPLLTWEGPMFSDSFTKAIYNAGVSEDDFDILVRQMMWEVDVRILAQMLSKRRR